jgi:hypothetical protein
MRIFEIKRLFIWPVVHDLSYPADADSQRACAGEGKIKALPVRRLTGLGNRQ